MSRKRLVLSLILCCLVALGSSVAVAARAPAAELSHTVLATGLSDGSGSTIGPDGALYVTEGIAGELSRVDLETGEVTTVASGLPQSFLGIGGAMDVAFLDGTPYVIVTLVGSDLGGSDIVGLYRIDGPDSYTIIADIGQWAIDHPPDTSYFIPTGVTYAIEAHAGGFLITDGHHNRVLFVTPEGEIREVITFGNIVPTGLAVKGQKVFMGQAGQVPHLPEDGKVVVFGPRIRGAHEVASGARLLVDVEFGAGHNLYALAQGEWDGVMEGSPAFPDTGALMQVNWDGSLTTLYEPLDRPTSLEIVDGTAYIITLDGEVWQVDGLAVPPKKGK
jgi:hypothetical protein